MRDRVCAWSFYILVPGSAWHWEPERPEGPLHHSPGQRPGLAVCTSRTLSPERATLKDRFSLVHHEGGRSRTPIGGKSRLSNAAAKWTFIWPATIRLARSGAEGEMNVELRRRSATRNVSVGSPFQGSSGKRGPITRAVGLGCVRSALRALKCGNSFRRRRLNGDVCATPQLLGLDAITR
jgi:hypothetical protein